MEQAHLEIILEDMNGRFDVLIEDHRTSRIKSRYQSLYVLTNKIMSFMVQRGKNRVITKRANEFFTINIVSFMFLVVLIFSTLY